MKCIRLDLMVINSNEQQDKEAPQVVEWSPILLKTVHLF